MDLSRTAKLIVSWFEVEQLPFFVVGAVALEGYGIGRQTADIDFLTDRSLRQKLVIAMEGWGFETLHSSPGYSNHRHTDVELGRVDFIYSDAETIAAIAADSSSIKLSGVTFRVPAPEHLIAMKVLAMKNEPQRTWKDMRDIQNLMGVEGVDLDEVERQFIKHGLIKRYEQIRETL